MADREKVVEHFRDAIGASGSGNQWRFVRVDIIEDAIELLKAQEPVKPHYLELVIPGQWDKLPFCGVCGCTLGYSARFCPHCGREVDWNAKEST